MDILESWCHDLTQEWRGHRAKSRAVVHARLVEMVHLVRDGVMLTGVVVDALGEKVRIELWLDGDGSDWADYIRRQVAEMTVDGKPLWAEVITHTPGSLNR